jgi:tetratricopeptide (TPR) repeat protein
VPDPRTKLVEELFQKVADLPEPQRAQFLDEQCGADEGLRKEIETLLRHESEATAQFLVRGAETTTLPLSADLPGTTLGRYKVLDRIGEGGFGEVLLAEQTEPVQRKVALKIVKLGMDTRQVVARFEAERQALALMDHPHIATVYDAGATDAGRPFFAMEFVAGVPITKYCDRERLDTNGRLHLFLQICSAIQHAHQKGVIHRDLKPSNVLVARDGDEHVPKVIDFGIAKAMGPHLTERTLYTEQGQLIGTPEYMSPEQAQMSAANIDTRTDIYSLGVLLYEVLVGALPFDPDTFRSKGLKEIQHVICEVEPPKPSTRLSSIEGDAGKSPGRPLEAITRHRRTDLRTLRRSLKGDLDWILMKAMAKEPTRRYASASEFAADIRRHLNHEPVLAGPPGTAYRLAKFVRRNRAAVVWAALIMLVLAGGVIGILVQAARATREARSASEISAFLNDMLASVDPLQVRRISGFAPPGLAETPTPGGGYGGDVTVAEMMRHASAGIEEKFADKPELEALARETIGMTFQSLWQFEDARDHLQTALDIRREILGRDHPDTLRSMLQLGYSLWDARRGEYEEAETLVRRAYEGMRRREGPEDPKMLSAAHILANVLSRQRRFGESEVLYRNTVDAQSRVLGSEHRDTLMTRWDWADSHLNQGKEIAGEDKARTLYDTCRRTLGPDDSVTIMSQILVGVFAGSRGDDDEAESLLRTGLEKSRRVLGEDHPFTYYTTRLLAMSLSGPDDAKEREGLVRSAMEGLLGTVGEEHYEAHTTMRVLGMMLLEQGKPDDGIDLVRRHVEIMARALGEDHLLTAIEMHRLAGVLARAGRDEEALDYATRAVGAARRVAEHPGASPLEIYYYARLLLTIEPPEMRDAAAALAAATTAVASADDVTLAERHLGQTAYLFDTLAWAHEMAGDLQSATRIRMNRLRLLMDLEAGAWEVTQSAWWFIKQRGLPEDAYDLALLAAEQADSMRPHDATSLTTLGGARYRAGQYENALAALHRAVEADGGVNPPNLAFLALVYDGLGREQDATAATARLRELMWDPQRAADADNALIWQEAQARLGRHLEALTLNVPDEYPMIRDAVDAAVSGAEVIVADGVYTGSGNRDIDFAGKLITVRSANGPERCTVDCEGAGRAFVFQNGETAGAVLEGFTIRNGATEGNGGAVQCEASSPTIRNCTFVRNVATAAGSSTGHGGAIHLAASAATLENCRFIENSAAGGRGGGIACRNGSASVIRNCLFAGNTAQAGEGVLTGIGGGLHSANSSPTISTCRFDENRAIGGTLSRSGSGAGVHIAGGRVKILDCQFTGNEAIGRHARLTGMGGAILASLGGHTITGCTFTDNRASGGPFSLTGLGGGLQISSSASVTVTGCTFRRNAAVGGPVGVSGVGGGIVCSEPQSRLRLTNCVLTGNTATGHGGGMWNGGVSGGPSPSIVNCTFSGNHADGGGGGIYSAAAPAPRSAPALVNCIVWGNSPDQIVDAGGAVTVISCSTVQGGWPGRGNISTDPLFIDPINDDFRVAAGSTCIDAGDNSAVSVDTDFEGKPRFVDDASTPDTGQGDPPIVDVGAYEYQR